MDDDNVRPMPRRPQRPQPSAGWQRWRGRILAVAIPLVLVVMSLLRYWVDVLWFDELGQRDVIVTRLQWGLAMAVAFGLLTFFTLWLNFLYARRVARDDLYVPFLAVNADPEAPEQPVIPHFVLRPILFAVAVVAAIIAGLIMSSRWEVVLRFLGRTDFGVNDPHFHKDASFYVFTMPLLELVARSLQVLLVITGIAVALAYIATGVIRYTPVPRVARAAIVHLSWLVAAFLLVSAFQYRLSIWGLATSTTGYVAGAGWTDVHARIPGYWLMIVASVILAVVVVMYARREKWRVIGTAVVGWFVASIIVTGVIPSLVQQVLVNPNEPERESSVIKGNIKNTRIAFGLDSIETVGPIRDEASLTEAELLRENAGTTENLRLWSPLVLASVLNQDQVIRRYYKFNVPDVDRYDVDGDYRQVMVSVRELDPDATNIAAGWSNEHLAYTHGYGAVATFPNERTREGKPEYLLRNLPPTAIEEAKQFELRRPEVYFGEDGTDYVIVRTKQREISGADAGDDGAKDKAAPNYDGDGGIPVRGLGRRIAFAATFRDPRILFSGQFTSKSRLMFRRTIDARIRELAPFLELDHDPYAVIVDGRIKWIQDAYTTSDRFPYSEPIELGKADKPESSVGVAGSTTRINYVRNSVKVVIDAYDGTVKFYAMDEDDPILAAWRDIFPTLFTSKSKLPRELRSHLRYPEDLFEVQTQHWKRYHMTDASDFYQQSDAWEVPAIGNAEMQAYYVLARLPKAKDEELLLIRPLTPRGRKNMVAYMVAQSDGDNYGKVQTLRLSTQENTQGPSQVQARIKQDPEVSEQVRLWDVGGNQVIYGDLLVLPIEDSLLYAQPVYLENDEANIPEFQKIVLVLGESIAWGDDFPEAARNLLQERAQDVDNGGETTPQGEDETPAPQDGGPEVPTPAGDAFEGMSQQELAQALGEIQAAYDRAQACQEKGDTVCFAREIERIEQLLDDARPARS